MVSPMAAGIPVAAGRAERARWKTKPQAREKGEEPGPPPRAQQVAGPDPAGLGGGS